MFSDKRMSLVRRTVAATLLAGAAVGVAHAQTMIVQSTGPSASKYPAGKKLPNGTTIELKANDRVTVLDGSGTRVLTGPRTVDLGSTAEEGQASSKIAGFLKYDRRNRTGAVRGGPVAGTGAAAVEETESPDRPSPNLWFVNASQGGRYCVSDPRSVGLWRAVTTDAASGMLMTADGGAQAEVAWTPGDEILAWPKENVPIMDGASYTLRVEGAANPVTIELKMIGQLERTATAEQVAAALIENDCQIQLNTMVRTLATLPPEQAFGGDGAD